ncbi:hypothetical protein [Pseudoflavitalea sp. G-6-1-2]|uniref:hypothetical protein n=1 Tax=Pseudoflavitalea sp. G-6-1-2 TaxID=2728841 RepID=UPI00197FF3D0|nr:hypothetical protein [Pseudoflavitalea sp. G-6-1-2]
MDTGVSTIIRQLEECIQKAHQSGNKYDFIDPAYPLCEELEELENPAEAMEPLFRLIESSPDIDYGGPGPIGQFLESFDGGIFEESLLQSLQRKPTLYTLSLLDTLLQDSNDPRQAHYLDTMRGIAVNAALPDNIRQQATENLQYAVVNLHAWDDTLKEKFAAVESMLEQAEQQLEQQRKSLRANEPRPPMETVDYDGIRFKVITRSEAAAYLPNITDIPGVDRLYDVWDEWRFPTWHENAFFLLAETAVTTEKLRLDYAVPGTEGITVLGFIFLQNLQVASYIMAFDTDNSPALVVHGKVECPCIHLFGNVHYFGGTVNTELLWTKYNHGELYIDANINAKVILADDMSVFIRKAGEIGATISLMGMNIYLNTGSEWLQQPATHSIEDVFRAEVCITDEEGFAVLKEEGPGNAIEYILQHKSLLK